MSLRIDSSHVKLRSAGIALVLKAIVLVSKTMSRTSVYVWITGNNVIYKTTQIIKTPRLIYSAASITLCWSKPWAHSSFGTTGGYSGVRLRRPGFP